MAEEEENEELGAFNCPLLAVDDVLLREFIELLPDDDIRAIVFSCQQLRRVTTSPPYSRTLRTPSHEHIMSSLALTKWALASNWVWPRQRVIKGCRRPGACEVAAAGGCQSVLDLARSHGCPWDFHTCSAAAGGGHLEVLQWAHANGCRWDSVTCSEAAGGGHLEVLQWARANGCPWDEFTCYRAAGGGHLEVLQWAHANGCRWDSSTCNCAAGGGHLEVLQWARANGCPWDSSTCYRAAGGGHLEVLQWARANGCPQTLQRVAVRQ